MQNCPNCKRVVVRNGIQSSDAGANEKQMWRLKRFKELWILMSTMNLID